MLNYKQTGFFKTVERAVLAGAAFTEEGLSAVYTREGSEGNLEVKPSTGAANETFAGFNFSANVPTTHMPKVEEGAVPAVAAGVTPKVTLARVPTAGQLLVKVAGVALEVVPGDAAPADAGKVGLSASGVLSFHADHMGKTLFVQYHYELTATEARTETGDYYGGADNTAARVFNQTGLIVEGECSTNMYDAAADWSAVINPKLGPNGMLTTSGTGTTLTNVFVTRSPNSDNAFLQLEIRS